MAIKEIMPPQAREVLLADPSAVYIDVRTEREFANGHPQGAVNIPVAFPDPARGMVMNPDFVKVVESHFPKEKKIIVGCQAGPRSNAAAGLLQQAGYQDVANMVGGFGGMRDPSGNVVAPGWAASGLPVSQDNGEGVSYQSLAAKAR
ncbi:MAG: rhodanese-like domain-containing protein [Deltaproteobacteria bacterium]|nr:rhodanese-like domain-containing protein [Deltaproteobacteria bacterium]MBI2232077.1 rhodanese-like domain-containing protein [Deltaproteobacteria bacterium]MBI2366629.1 rhodanese-like domain-containing protein [Deltaproteobacteria bacterium]MBI2534551.1 rhodanese-like domain-containing protein [Deltaproteobacteria bacterium]